MQWAGQMSLLGCHLLSAQAEWLGRMQWSRRIWDLSSAPTFGAQRRGGAAIISWDVLEKQAALLPPPLLSLAVVQQEGQGQALGAVAGAWSGSVLCSL